MNLADAIRQAAHAPVRSTDNTPATPDVSFVRDIPHAGPIEETYTKPRVDPSVIDNRYQETAPVREEIASVHGNGDVHLDDAGIPHEDGAHTSGGLIRLDLFLPPDQIERFLRYVATTQHSVMTLREAASHLRISPTRLEQMAIEKRAPGFLVDGKWRFSRARLEEWLAQIPDDKEQAS